MRGMATRGLTLTLRHKRLKAMEITERRQVGDAESLVNRGSAGPGRYPGDDNQL